MKVIQTWIESKGGFAHVAAMTWIFLVGAYYGSPQVHSAVRAVLLEMPPLARHLALCAVGLIAFYKNTDKEI